MCDHVSFWAAAQGQGKGKHDAQRMKGEAVTCLNNVSSCTGHMGDNGLVCATPSIQQAAFTHIGSANQGYLQMHSTVAVHRI